MSNRVVNQPEPVEMCNPINGEKLGDKLLFSTFFLGNVMADQSWGQSFEMLLQAIDIRDKFKKAAGGPFELTEVEWQKCCDVARRPAQGYNPVIMAQAAHFVRALLDAKPVSVAAQSAAQEAAKD